MNLLNRTAVRRWLRKHGEAKPLFGRPIAMRRVLNQIEELAAEKMDPAELKEQMKAARATKGAFADIIERLLAFLDAHWADILALILKFLPK